MRFLVRLVPEGSSKDRTLSAVRTLAKSLGAEARNPKWTSHGALEIDLFCPTRGDFDLLLAALSPVYRIEHFRDLNIAPTHRTDGEIIAEARDLFNAERYWECHETLEGLWRVKDGDEKSYLQGLILLCAAFVHHQKGEKSVALGVLNRAIARLDYPGQSYHGLEVAKIKERASAILDSGTFLPFSA